MHRGEQIAVEEKREQTYPYRAAAPGMHDPRSGLVLQMLLESGSLFLKVHTHRIEQGRAGEGAIR